jgi:hypothetical protein
MEPTGFLIQPFKLSDRLMAASAGSSGLLRVGGRPAILLQGLEAALHALSHEQVSAQTLRHC